ncbi:MAG: YHS domain-containing protein [Pseudomonadota bacterium]
MLRILIFAFLSYIAYRVIKRIFGPSKEIDRGPSGGVIDEMVQDPFCKTYIPRREAVKKMLDGKQLFFCSDECASKFESEKRQD